MNLNLLIKKINNIDKQLIPLDSLQGKMKLRDFIELLKQLKESKYCFPVIFNNNLKFNFITIPLWGTHHKQYKIKGEVYSHIEKL